MYSPGQPRRHQSMSLSLPRRPENVLQRSKSVGCHPARSVLLAERYRRNSSILKSSCALITASANGQISETAIITDDAIKTPCVSTALADRLSDNSEPPASSAEIDDLDERTNSPHPMLECPPLYYLLRNCCPTFLESTRSLYKYRWALAYPMQKRLPLSRSLQKIKLIFTWSEIFLLLPFFACIVAAGLYSFVWPSVSLSGHASRTPLLFAFISVMHNSVLTLILGLPFERALRYHKLSARIAYINGLLHTYVAFRYPEDSSKTPSNLAVFLTSNDMNLSGTVLVVCMTCIILTALPMVRRRFFELFYFTHQVLCVGMATGAFFHTGILVPLLAGTAWGVDILIRKVLMARRWYPQEANISVVSSTVVEISFPKTKGFAFNPGQYIFLCVPEISFWQWHPFSLASSPEQEMVTLYVRNCGGWTNRLYQLASQRSKIQIHFEGPFGSVGVNLQNEKYGMVMLLSGGIGVTPMQSICNQLMYEHHLQRRQLKKLSFVWIERDPQVFEKVDVVRRSLDDASESASEDDDVRLPPRMFSLSHAGNIASSLLSLVPPSLDTDEELDNQYVDEEVDIPDDSKDVEEGRKSSDVGSDPEHGNGVDEDIETGPSCSKEVVTCAELVSDDKVVELAYSDISEPPLDLKVYLTCKNPPLGMPSFVNYGRPKIHDIFRKLRSEAIAAGERRVAVCVCAPKRLVDICSKACARFSDRKVAFDFHYEVFD